MSLIPFGFWAASGAGGAPYYITLLTGVSGSGGIAYGGAAQYLGRTDTAGYNIQFDSSGSIEWQRELSGTGSFRVGDTQPLAMDSSGNSGSWVRDGESSPYGGTMVKRNSSGVLQWQRKYARDSFSIQGCTADSSGNFLALIKNGSNTDIIKWNSAGTLQFSKQFSTNDWVSSIAADSADNYLLAREEAGGVTKLNSSGAIVWQKGYVGNFYSGAKVGVDSSDNAFYWGRQFETGNDKALLFKHNSSGTEQWQRSVTAPNSSQILADIKTDSDDNIYVVLEDNGNQDFYIIKYNTSGTVVWQRKITSSGDYYPTIAINEEFMYVAFRPSSTTAFVLALPTDGSLTDTYTVGAATITYSASSLTTGTVSISSKTVSTTIGDTGVGDSAGALSDSASSITQTILTI